LRKTCNDGGEGKRFQRIFERGNLLAGIDQRLVENSGSKNREKS